mmetsp:Transcript_28443/g.45667  ORF Transcript_28443/g.45667 Transcript_28443/m.45667 type:complete len:1007 (+) Transcript_28443:35-3055(+)
MAHFDESSDKAGVVESSRHVAKNARVSVKSSITLFHNDGFEHAYPDVSESDGRASTMSGGAIGGRPTQQTIGTTASTGTYPSSRPTRRKSMIKEQQKAMQMAAKAKSIPRYVSCSRRVVENKFVMALTTFLTIYALVGDDLRLLTTNMPADDVFNAFTVFCIAIFLFEIILSSFGKDDYFGGFFFILDAVSTATLVLDLTWVSDAILGDEEDVDSLSGSENVRLGARTARVVRVLRLVRILKLYKAIYEARAKQKRAQEKLREKRPGEEEDDWEDGGGHHDDVKLESLQRGSRVGRKLSDLTTRKVIILVLSMMLMIPILRVDQADQFAFSPHYAADLVHESFVSWRAALDNAVDAYTQGELHRNYVKQMLQLIYYHNWYTGQNVCEDCPGMYYNHLFWVGIVSQESSSDYLVNKAAQARLTSADVAKYEADVVIPQDDDFSFGSYPPIVQQTVGSAWTPECSDDSILRVGFSLLKDELDGSVGYAVKCPNGLRKVEREKFSARVISKSEAKVWHFGFYFDKRKYTKQESIFSLILTAFVCFMLTVAAVTFTNDAESMVLNPLEIMISKVERIRDNPLMAMKMSDEEFRQEEIRKQEQQKALMEETRMKMLKDKLLCKSAKHRTNEPMETVILEKTIIKIGSLLALGFGEAGANIIEQNMSGSDSAMVTAMIEGESVECIIGCARIQNFSAATEVLGGNVMAFVNRISEIVHGGVDEFHGAANKNNGDQYLIIWRTSDLDDGYSSKLADMSVVAFARILGAVNRSPVLANYRGHPGLQQKIGSDFRVNLTFSLHYGWAIEGAVGSEFKIDASYLSPNVSIAESLEAATTTYRVNILLSDRVLRMCTPEATSKCRLIDRVFVSGETMELYCIDLDYRSLSVQEAPKNLPQWNPRQRFKVRQFLESEKSSKWGERIDILELFNEDPDISTMRFRYTLEFTHVFMMGYQNYSEGEWQVAQRFLHLTRSMLGMEDGPSIALLGYMEEFGFVAPVSWKGIRDLSFQDSSGS